MAGQTEMSSILSLPRSVRIQIYRCAGLMFDANIIIPRHPKPKTPSPPSPSSADLPDSMFDMDFGFLPSKEERDWPFAEDLRMTSTLGLICKTIHAEVSAVFYSENDFFFEPKDIADLEWLRLLQPTSISHLRHLAFRVNGLSDDGLSCGLFFHPKTSTKNSWFLNAICNSKANHDPDNGASLLQTQTNVLTAWSMGIEHIIRHVTPKILSLFLECDVNNPEIAASLVDPLLISNHDILAKCCVRLGWRKDPILEALARKTVLHVGGDPSLPKQFTCFPYLRLPFEIRRKILEYTDLVAPYGEVDWSPRLRYHLSHSDHEEWIGFVYGPHQWNSCDGPCRFQNCLNHPDSGCFCQNKHAAYSIDCRCWNAPLSFFQVCKTMREDAEAVFFCENRIVVKSIDVCARFPLKTNPVRLDLSEFFNTSIRRSALRHIRDLELSFPPLSPDYCDEGPVLEDWRMTVRLMKQYMNLPQLTLRVYMKGDQHEIDASARGWYMSKLTAAQNRILMPLSDLTGLNRLYLHLPWPGVWGEPVPNFDYVDTQLYMEKRRERRNYLGQMCTAWEEEMGRKIMGDDYERSQLGRSKECHSNWYQVWRLGPEDQ